MQDRFKVRAWDTEEDRYAHPTVISQKNVKQRVETQFDDDNVDAKVEVTGYDYSTVGGR